MDLCVFYNNIPKEQNHYNQLVSFFLSIPHVILKPSIVYTAHISFCGVSGLCDMLFANRRLQEVIFELHG